MVFIYRQQISLCFYIHSLIVLFNHYSDFYTLIDFFLFIMVVTPMCANVIRTFYDYIQQASVFHLDLIRGDNPHSFTRNRHNSVIDLVYQMLN